MQCTLFPTRARETNFNNHQFSVAVSCIIQNKITTGLIYPFIQSIKTNLKSHSESRGRSNKALVRNALAFWGGYFIFIVSWFWWGKYNCKSWAQTVLNTKFTQKSRWRRNPNLYHLILASKFSLPNVFVFSTNERNVCDICVKYHIRKSSFDSNFCAFLL